MARRPRGGGGGGGGDARRGPGGGNIHEQVGASMAFITPKCGMRCSMGPAAAERMKRAMQSSDCDGMEMLDNMDGSDSDSDDSVGMECFGSLHEAAIAGKMDTCKHLVDKFGLDVNAQATGELGLTPLACAVSHGKVISVRFFLDKGANPDKEDNIGFTPLHYAVKEGHYGLARLLLSRGASVDVSSSEGTPLHLAATSGKAGIMQILLEHNADAGDDLNCTIPDTPLVIATCKCLTECVEYLLEAGVDANIPINHDGKTPIEIATKYARRKLVEILFPFTKPIRGVSNWSVEGLIAHTKSRNPKDKAKVTEKDRKAQLKSLGAKAFERNDYAGASKFYSESLHCEIQLLNQFGAPSWRDNNINSRSLSLLLKAAKVGDINVMKMLLMGPHWRLSGSSSTQEPRIVWLLLKNGAKVLQGNKLGFTSVHSAAASGNYKVLQNGSANCVKPLLCFGANTKVQNLRKQRKTDVAAWQDIHFILNSANVVPGNRNSLKIIETSEFGPVEEAAVIGLKIGNSGGFEKASSVRYSVQECLEPEVTDSMLDGELSGLLGFLVDPVSTDFRGICTGVRVLAYPKLSDCMDSFRGICRMRLVLVGNSSGPAKRPTHIVLLPSVSQPKYECSEPNLQNEHGGDSSHDFNTKSGLVQPVPFMKSDLVLPTVTIFIEYLSGELSLQVDLGEPVKKIMALYQEKTGIRANEYFIYGRRILEDQYPLTFYDVGYNSTIEVRTRLLGGSNTLHQYLTSRRREFTRTVLIPDGSDSLEMLVEGCRVLSTWISCFTSTWMRRRSWDGEFNLDYFKVASQHVQVTIVAKRMLGRDSLKNDIEKLILYIERYFYVNGNSPPYVDDLITYLKVIKNENSGVITHAQQIFLDNHVSCIESLERGMLTITLKKKIRNLPKHQKINVEKLITSITWDRNCMRKLIGDHIVPVLGEMMIEAADDDKGYEISPFGGFRLLRDNFMHGLKYTPNRKGLELMQAVHLKGLLPSAICVLVMDPTFDIEQELLAAKPKCLCPLCPKLRDEGTSGGGAGGAGGGGGGGAGDHPAEHLSPAPIAPEAPSLTSTQTSWLAVARRSSSGSSSVAPAVRMPTRTLAASSTAPSSSGTRPAWSTAGRTQSSSSLASPPQTARHANQDDIRRKEKGKGKLP